MTFSEKKIWSIIALLATVIVVFVFVMYFLPKEEPIKTVIEKTLAQENFEEVFIHGEIFEEITDCKNYYCFKVKVISSNKKEITDSLQEIKTNIPLEITKGNIVNIYATEEQGILFAEWQNIFPYDMLINEGFE